MKERLESIKERYQEITNELTNPEIMSDFQKIKKLSKDKIYLKEMFYKYE